ncbi:MAG: hypothetical protein Q4G08_11310 [Capnocytophaga sp.]|nr:hypothetical protein [Capnocytophaga sp.]
MIALLQDKLPDIQQKIAEAPDSSYEIGIFIGSLLPYVVLVVLAYLLYSYMKRNKDTDNVLDD